MRILLPSGILDNSFSKEILDSEWQTRISDVVSSSDNELIPRVINAGTIKKGKQIMHNGISISLGGYYGSGIVQMLQKNKGVHEPQEEYVFQEVLKHIPKGSSILELGSYWSFYSMWFLKEIQGGNAFLIEPSSKNLLYGKNNFRINQLKGKFYQSFIDEKSSFDSNKNKRRISVDDFIQKEGIQSLEILHSDIQGFEFNMLKGAIKSFQHKIIKYVFISTHSNELHYNCIDLLKQYEFEILCDSDLNHTFSYDGLIVAKLKGYKGMNPIHISQKHHGKI